jgi:hypothetical protein
MPEPFVRRDPDGQAWKIGVGEEVDHLGALRSDGALAHADTSAGQHEVPVGHLIIAAEREALAGHGKASGAKPLDDQVAPVITDQVMVKDVVQTLGPTAPGDVVPCCVKADGQIAQMPRHHIKLRGPIHAKRDVCLVEQEVLGCVAGGKLDRKAGMRFAKPGKDRGSKKPDTTSDAVSLMVPVVASACPAA